MRRDGLRSCSEFLQAALSFSELMASVLGQPQLSVLCGEGPKHEVQFAGADILAMILRGE